MRAFKFRFEVKPDGVFGQMRELWSVIFDHHARRSLFRYAMAITAVIGANAVMQIRLNNWQGHIYDAIGSRDVSIFMKQVELFLIIVSVLLCLGVAQTWLHERLKVRLRQAVIFDLLDEWLRPHRISQLKLAGEISAHPDQRIQDDAKRLSELSVDLAVGLVQSSLLLFAFTGVLWELSAQVVFSIDGKAVTIPGYMVWAAIGFSIIGSGLTWFVGKPLIKGHSELRAKEANFRFALVRLNEASEEVAFTRGEARERRLIETPVNSLLDTMRMIAGRLAALTWVTGGFGWLAILAPLLLAAPGYFSGALTLGGLMMVVGAFYQVQNALRWYVDRFPVIAEWRAMLSRVSGYRHALKRTETLGKDMGHIHHVREGYCISIEDLAVFSPSGTLSLNVPHLRVEPGRRMLIVATPKSGKTTFAKALAGLWIWGSGTVRLPAVGLVMYVPGAPYVPAGSLRQALSYPDDAGAFPDSEIQAAISRVGMNSLGSDLDAVRRWDKELAIDERQRLVLGRLLLHRPKWIVSDESLSELDEQTRKIATAIFSSELKDTAVLSVGRHSPEDAVYDQIYFLQSRYPGLRQPLQFAAP
jgi:putative ATP-binding cassette transporter